jgi:hypothetical protein
MLGGKHMGEDPSDIAHERASRYAPLPAYDPSQAGLAGAAVVGVIIAVFAGFARLDLDAFAPAFSVSVALGFGLPFAYFWNQRRKHYDAWSKEYEQLRKERDA